jgi:hypothetical protein
MPLFLTKTRIRCLGGESFFASSTKKALVSGIVSLSFKNTKPDNKWPRIGGRVLRKAAGAL